MFFINGGLLASWVTRIPDVRNHLHLNNGQLGLALLGIGIGALIAFPAAGWLIARHGSRSVTTLSSLGLCLSLALPALAPNLALLTLALILLGACNGAMDVAMNAHGVEVEGLWGSPILSSFHGMFSLGGFVGAALGGAAAGIGMSAESHFLVVAAIAVVATALAARALLPVAPHARGGPAFAFPTRAILGLGTVAFCAYLSEGSMGDWSAVYLRNDLHTGPGFAASGFAAFSLAMIVGRFSGDALTARLGPSTMLRVGGAISAIGLGASLALIWPPLAVVGFGCVGLGLSAVVPLAFSATGRVRGTTPGAALAAVSTMAYTGALMGPPAIGGLAQIVTLRGALLVPVILSVVIVLLAGGVRQTPATA
jgi:MFS family permease